MATATVVLTCGCSAHAVHENAHDGMPARHPCCVIHGHCSVTDAPDLAGRTAKCYCGSALPSSPALAFFQYHGPGSASAASNCKHCGCHAVAHDQGALDQRDRNEGRKPDHRAEQHAFEPRGPAEFDSYYCGCNGWD